MTLLLAFFVLLLSFSSIQEAKFHEALSALQSALGVMESAESVLENPSPDEVVEQKDEVEELDTQMAEVVEMLQEEGMQSEFDVIPTKDGYAVRLSSPILFDLASANLRTKGSEMIGKLASYLAGFDYAIRVEGHTDDVPIKNKAFPSNWELSTARALSVLKLMKNYGIAPVRLSAVGYGEFKPLVDNETQDQREINRRVEIYVTVKGNEDVANRLLDWR